MRWKEWQFKKIDRVLCTTSWATGHPQHLLRCLALAASDHCPLVVDCSMHSPGKRRFHFERFWVKLDVFLPTVDEASNWNPPPPRRRPVLANLRPPKGHSQAPSELGLSLHRPHFITTDHGARDHLPPRPGSGPPPPIAGRGLAAARAQTYLPRCGVAREIHCA